MQLDAQKKGPAANHPAKETEEETNPPVVRVDLKRRWAALAQQEAQ